MKRFMHLRPDLQQIIDNPGTTVEDLQEKVKKLALTLQQVTDFLDGDLVNHVFTEAERTHKRCS